MKLVNQPTNKPTRKVAAVGISGSALVIVAVVLSALGIDLSALGIDANELPVGEALTALVVFAAGYMRKEAA